MHFQTLTKCLFLTNCLTLSLAIEPQAPLLSNTNSLSSHSTTSESPLLSLHRSLIEHSSITENEHSVALYLSSYLRSQNFTVELQPVASTINSSIPRENILAYLGTTRETRVLISSHIDTVPPFWPYERKGDEIWGRGSVDAKGSVATQITAVLDLISAGKIEEGDIALLFVVGEETGGEGMKTANALDLSWETVIFGEPTELKLASGHKGITGFEITAKGKAGHSGYPELGKSANAMLIEVLWKLMNTEFPWSRKYGNTTLNVGTIEGGVAPNVIAEDAKAKIAVRIAEGGPEEVERIVRKVVGSVGEGMDVVFRMGYGPVYIDSDVPGKSFSPTLLHLEVILLIYEKVLRQL